MVFIHKARLAFASALPSLCVQRGWECFYLLLRPSAGYKGEEDQDP